VLTYIRACLLAGGSSKDDKGQVGGVGNVGSRPHVASALEHLNEEERRRLHDYARKHSVEETTIIEELLLEGKSFDEACRLAANRVP
jgi:hypothetical protein